MESEFERIVESERKILATNPELRLFFGTTFFVVPGLAAFLGWLVDDFDFRVAVGVGLCWISAAFIIIYYHHNKQARLNVELVNAIKEIRERLDEGAKEEDV